MTDRPARHPRMIVFDSSYTVRLMRERAMAPIVTGRDLGGYFEHIWTIHPVASLVEGEDPAGRYGAPAITELAPRHTIIEGKIGRYRWLRWFAALNFLLTLFALYRIVRRVVRVHGIDFVRSEDPTMNGVFAWATAKRFGLPLLIGVWGNPGAIRAQTGQPLMRRLFPSTAAEDRVERFVLPRADLVMAQNEDNRQFCIRQGAKPERTAIFRLGNLLHASHFREPAERGDGEAKLAELGVANPCVIAISRLEPLKLLDHVVRAIGHLKDRGRSVSAIIVGDGPHREGLLALATELGVAERIHLIGARSQEWLADVIPAVTAVVSPLTGRALAEAGLGGTPIVAYDIDWHSELIRSGETGELVPHLDHGALADAIARIVDDPARAATLGQNLRAHTLAMMDPVAADRDQIAAYEALLDRRRPRL